MKFKEFMKKPICKECLIEMKDIFPMFYVRYLKCPKCKKEILLVRDLR